MAFQTRFIANKTLTTKCFIINYTGSWNTRGCNLLSYNETTNQVICECNHLTNFACLVVSHACICIVILILHNILHNIQASNSEQMHVQPLLTIMFVNSRTSLLGFLIQVMYLSSYMLALEIMSYVGVVLSLVGLVIVIITYLA